MLEKKNHPFSSFIIEFFWFCFQDRSIYLLSLEFSLSFIYIYIYIYQKEREREREREREEEGIHGVLDPRSFCKEEVGPLEASPTAPSTPSQTAISPPRAGSMTLGALGETPKLGLFFFLKFFFFFFFFWLLGFFFFFFFLAPCNELVFFFSIFSSFSNHWYLNIMMN
jgi:hypothetical protein